LGDMSPATLELGWVKLRDVQRHDVNRENGFVLPSSRSCRYAAAA
jgi:hypothetical protein